MKNYKYSLLSLILLTLAFSACQKLEDRPLQLITEEYLWDTKDSLGTNASYFLNTIYGDLPNGYNRIGSDLLDAATDDAVPSADNTAISRFTNGGYSPLTNDDNSWTANYASIRKCNLFLENFPKVTLKLSIRQEAGFWMAENRFLRAMFYFELIKRYGGVPLLGDRILTLQDDLKIPRNSFDECVNYIVSELDAVTPNLRVDGNVLDGDYGRITKAAALALKTKVLVYAASPLNNPSNDVAKWRKAKNAAAEFIRTNTYYSLVSSYPTVFTVRKNTEVILAYQRPLTFDVETNNAPVGYVSGTTTSRGRTSPTQELVDAFPTNKGLAISADLKSPTNPTGYDPNQPYANRDPRLLQTVFVNGLSAWLGRPVETFTGGKDRPGGIVVQTKTGYYMRKFMADFSSGTAYSNQSHNFPIFRYADILLMFAEAKNEVDGPGLPTDSVYTYLKAIRARAGLIAGASATYGLPTTAPTMAQMRDIIRNDRRIEMAFEEQRFWDLRRWKIAENVYNKPLHGIRITRSGTILSYQIEELSIPFQFFAPRMYRYAIPYSEISKNTNLTQNEGYQ